MGVTKNLVQTRADQDPDIENTFSDCTGPLPISNTVDYPQQVAQKVEQVTAPLMQTKGLELSHDTSKRRLFKRACKAYLQNPENALLWKTFSDQGLQFFLSQKYNKNSKKWIPLFRTIHETHAMNGDVKAEIQKLSTYLTCLPLFPKDLRLQEAIIEIVSRKKPALKKEVYACLTTFYQLVSSPPTEQRNKTLRDLYFHYRNSYLGRLFVSMGQVFFDDQGNFIEKDSPQVANILACMIFPDMLDDICQVALRGKPFTEICERKKYLENMIKIGDQQQQAYQAIDVNNNIHLKIWKDYYKSIDFSHDARIIDEIKKHLG